MIRTNHDCGACNRCCCCCCCRQSVMVRGRHCCCRCAAAIDVAVGCAVVDDVDDVWRVRCSVGQYQGAVDGTWR